ncbi:MAG: hypothetical protein ACKOZU_03690, partial [Planctomycetaceae bacterium]
ILIFILFPGRAVSTAIGAAGVRGCCAPAAPVEVDLVVRPGAGRFRGAAECRLLVADPAWRPARQGGDGIRAADVLITAAADDATLAARLDAAL